jgi:hypothetical protein
MSGQTPVSVLRLLRRLCGHSFRTMQLNHEYTPMNTNGNTAKEVARPSPPPQRADQADLSYQKISAISIPILILLTADLR